MKKTVHYNLEFIPKMAIHTNLPIYKSAYDLLDVVTEMSQANAALEKYRSQNGR